MQEHAENLRVTEFFSCCKTVMVLHSQKCAAMQEKEKKNWHLKPEKTFFSCSLSINSQSLLYGYRLRSFLKCFYNVSKPKL